MSHNVKAGLCPYCGYHGDSATNPDGGDSEPAPGDWAMCIACAGMLVFLDDLSMRKITDEEMAKLTRGSRALVESMQAAQRKISHKVKREIPHA